MYGYFSLKNIPPKNKFSYGTAQEYTQLVKKSIQKHRSTSKSAKKVSLRISRMIGGEQQSFEKQKREKFLRLRQRIGDRSRSNSNRDSANKSREYNRHQRTASNLEYEIDKVPRAVLPKQIADPQTDKATFQKMYKQNNELQMQISSAETKIRKIQQNIEEQRSRHRLQRQLYQQQLNKLRQTLSMQVESREFLKSQSQECSFGEVLKADLTSSANEFLDQKSYIQ